MSNITSLGFNITSAWDGAGVLAARDDLMRLQEDMKRVSGSALRIGVMVDSAQAEEQLNALRAQIDRDQTVVRIGVVADTGNAVAQLDAVRAAQDGVVNGAARMDSAIAAQNAGLRESAVASNEAAAATRVQGDAAVASAEKTSAASGSMRDLAAVSGTAGTAMSTFAKVGVGAAVVGLGAGVKWAGDYQSALEHLVTSAGLAQGDMDAFGKVILQVSSDTGTSATDLANASYKVLSLGFSWQDTGKIMHTTAELAKVDNSDIVTTTQAVVQTLHDYNLGADQNVQVSNALRAAVERSNTTLGDFTNGIGRAEQSASALHMNFTQLYGALASLTEQGLPAQTAINLLSTTMDHLAASTPKSDKELEGLGLNVNQFRQQLASPNGLTASIETLNTAIRDHLGQDGLVYLQDAMKKSKGNVDEFAQAMGAAPGPIQTTVGALGDAVGGVRNLAVILGLSGDNTARFIDNVNHVQQAANQATDQVDGWSGVQQTFNQHMAEATQSLKNLGISVGTVLLPAVTSAMDAIRKGTDWLNEHKAVAETLMGIVIGLGAAWLAYKVNMIAVGAATTAYTLAVNTMKLATGEMTVAQWGLNAAEDANPIGAIILAVEALAAGIVLLATKTHFFQDAWQLTVDGVKQIWNGLKAAWDAVAGFFEASWTNLEHMASAEWNLIAGVWRTMVNAIQSTWDNFSSAFRATWEAFWNAIKAVGDAIWTALKYAFAAMLTGLIAAYDATLRPFSGIWSDLWNGIKQVGSDIWNGMRGAWNDFLGGVRSIWDNISGPLQSAWNAYWAANKQLATDIWNFLRQAWNDFLSAVRAIWDAISGPLQTAWNTLWNAIKQFVLDLWNLLRDNWNQFTRDIKAILDAIVGPIEDAWSTCWNTVKAVASQVWADIKGGFETFKDDVVATIEAMVKAVEDTWNKITAIFRKPVDDIKGIWNTVADKFGLGKFADGGPVGPGPVQKADGGAIYGPGGPRDDVIPAWLSNGEHVWTAAEVSAAGGHEAVMRMRRSVMERHGDPARDNVFADGGAVDRLSAAKQMAKEKGDGRAYVYGGSGPDGFDCSGYMSAIYNVLTGRAPWNRSFTTEDNFGALGFVGGLSSAFAIGVHNGGGGQNSHMAGTLDGVNVESGGAHNSTLYGGAAAGANAGEFEHQYSLPQVGGQFVSGGNGGGGGPTAEQIAAHDAAVAQIRKVINDTLGTTATMQHMIETGQIAQMNRAASPGFIGPVSSTQLTEAAKNKYGIYAPAGDVHGAGTKKAGDGAIQQLDAKLAAISSALGGAIPTGDRADLLKHALSLTNTPPPNTLDSWLSGLNTLIERESGWNSGAVNNWDSNAAAGTPSKGLMQLIDPTFRANHQGGTSDDIFDPLANVSAGINYIKSRYGDISNVQQANANMPPKGYMAGTNSAQSGWAMVGENGPEMVNFGGGEQVKTFEDIITALKDSSLSTAKDLESKMSGDLKSFVEQLIQQAQSHNTDMRSTLETEFRSLISQLSTDLQGSGQQLADQVEEAINRVLSASGISVTLPMQAPQNTQDVQAYAQQVANQLLPQLEMMIRQRVGAR